MQAGTLWRDTGCCRRELQHDEQGGGSGSKTDSRAVPPAPTQLSPTRFSPTFHPCLLTCVCRSRAASSRARPGSPIRAGCPADPGQGTKLDVAITIT